MSLKRSILKVFVFISIIFVGLVLGYGLSIAIDRGYFFTQWQQLPPPPSKAIAIVGVGNTWQSNAGTGVAIKGIDGNIYGCIYYLDNCWAQGQIPKSLSSPSKVGACTYSPPEFFFTANSPKNIVDCMQADLEYEESGVYITFAVDKDGNVWQWNKGGNGLASFMQTLGFLFSFGILGLVVGKIFVDSRFPRE